jgi:substrate import-associated zinc metallohydrolase lipoprotein
MKMKKLVFLFTIIFVALLSSCSKEKLGDSIFDDSERIRNEFDQWLLTNYAYPYNIDLKYRMEDIESDRTYTLAPAETDKAIKLAKLVKHLWIESYDEVAGITFTRTYIPKVIHFVGSPAFEANGSFVLGTAQGGLKVTLYTVNSLIINAAYLNTYYFHVMHHEFAHILHQTKKYDADFQKISDGEYVGGSWVNISNATAYQAGFVSPYSMNAVDEDFVELYSRFITMTPQAWNSILTQAGTQGASIINQKFGIITKYLKDVWDIDIYEMRDVVQRRSSEIFSLDLDNLK